MGVGDKAVYVKGTEAASVWMPAQVPVPSSLPPGLAVGGWGAQEVWRGRGEGREGYNSGPAL